MSLTLVRNPNPDSAPNDGGYMLGIFDDFCQNASMPKAAEERGHPIIICRVKAREAGLSHFFTGEPCPYGHVAIRRVSNRACLLCERDRCKRYWSGHKEAQISRKRAWNAANKDRTKAASAAWHLANREKALATAKVWKLANKDRVRSTTIAYKVANRDAIKKTYDTWLAANKNRRAPLMAAYRAANREAYSTRQRNRNAQKRNASGVHTKKDILDIFKAQRGRCAYCDKPLTKKYHVDHIVPISRGGTNDRRNLQCTCGPCNVSKRDKLPEDFARTIGLLI